MQTKSFLKWAGGKSKLVPFIENSLPKRPRKRLIEPFAGSAALSLALEFDSYLLNDSNHATNCAPNSTIARTSTSARHCLST